MYQALYRKWRPQVFADVIGQSHVTRTLKRQVAENRTSHAYLFTGTRGTGKTTCAKILARAVNCEHPEDGDPCGICPACTGIANGSYMDVLELDAASNNGVDQVRALRDEAIYAPVNVKKRVYIIDEVHMLSVPAFNALLKILEEPPEHLMFILATTELHKVPATILSRCQRYAFRRILPNDIEQRLLYVSSQEGIQLAPDGAELLARLADGALRDGLSLLDQCAAVSEKIDGATVLETLGLAGHLQTAQLLEYILQRDTENALNLFGNLYEGGKDSATVLGELSGLIRDLLLRQTAPTGSSALLSGGYDTPTLERLEHYTGVHRLLYMAETIQKSRAELQAGTNQRLQAEVCLVRLCDETLERSPEALISRVEQLETALNAVKSGRYAPMPESYAKVPEPSEPYSAIQTVSPSAMAKTETASLPETTAVTVSETVSKTETPVAHDTTGRSSAPFVTPSGVPFTTAAIPQEITAATLFPSDNAQVQESVLPEGETILPEGESVHPDWETILERCQTILPKMYAAFVERCKGVFDGDLLCVYGDGVTISRLNNERVQAALLEASRAQRIRLCEGEPPRTSPEENLRQLLAFSSHQDIITVKGGDMQSG